MLVTLNMGVLLCFSCDRIIKLLSKHHRLLLAIPCVWILSGGHSHLSADGGRNR
jgi:hypothetical protein